MTVRFRLFFNYSKNEFQRDWKITSICYLIHVHIYTRCLHYRNSKRLLNRSNWILFKLLLYIERFNSAIISIHNERSNELFAQYTHGFDSNEPRPQAMNIWTVKWTTCGNAFAPGKSNVIASYDPWNRNSGVVLMHFGFMKWVGRLEGWMELSDYIANQSINKRLSSSIRLIWTQLIQ